MAAEAKKTRKFVIRHLTRDKGNKEDPQTPTLGGELEAFSMGLLLRNTHRPNYTRCISSPQPRAIRTAIMFLTGHRGYTSANIPQIEKSDDLNDFSSDKRYTDDDKLKQAFKASKPAAALQSEQALFVCTEAQPLRQAKLDEAISTINSVTDEGDILFCGLHGGTIDGLYAHYAKLLNEKSPRGMAAFGRQIGKVEGFILTYEAGKIVSIEKVEKTPWLKALEALIPGPQDD